MQSRDLGSIPFTAISFRFIRSIGQKLETIFLSERIAGQRTWNWIYFFLETKNKKFLQNLFGSSWILEWNSISAIGNCFPENIFREFAFLKMSKFPSCCCSKRRKLLNFQTFKPERCFAKESFDVKFFFEKHLIKPVERVQMSLWLFANQLGSAWLKPLCVRI